MFEPTPAQDSDAVRRVIERLRAPVRIDPALDTRVMSSLTARDPRTSLGTWWNWLRQPRMIAVSPLATLATAALLVAVAVWWRGATVHPVPPPPPAPTTAIGDGPASVQFVVLARGASSVSLVGDFNDWDAGRTPMRLTNQAGFWTVIVPLAPGRHRYAYLVNGRRWVADPAAPRAPDDFGTPSSVVTVGG